MPQTALEETELTESVVGDAPKAETAPVENEEFEVKALSVSGQLLDKGQIDVLASLPTLHEALGMLASVTLAPVTKLVRTLNEIPTKTTRAVAAVRDAKEAA